jgi:hypothetical protein
MSYLPSFLSVYLLLSVPHNLHVHFQKSPILSSSTVQVSHEAVVQTSVLLSNNYCCQNPTSIIWQENKDIIQISSSVYRSSKDHDSSYSSRTLGIPLTKMSVILKTALAISRTWHLWRSLEMSVTLLGGARVVLYIPPSRNFSC